jgi:hypothetical protein
VQTVTKAPLPHVGRRKSNVPDACTCIGPCSEACRARRARRARFDRSGKTREATRKKKRRGRPGPARSNVPELCRCGGACSGACRARRFRRAHPEVRVARQRAYTVAAKEEQLVILEHRALAYVRRALGRGTIVPPRACDHCLSSSGPLVPFHPDPRRPRDVAWLCQNDRRSVPSFGGTIALAWAWPGVAGDSPRAGWHIEIDPAWVAQANAAIADLAVDGRIRDGGMVRRWAEVFFAAAPAAYRERIYALALRKRLRLDDTRLRALLQWWAELERDSRNRRAHQERDDHETEVTFEPRVRARGGAVLDDLASIGHVPQPPKTSFVPRPVREDRRPDEEVLADIDAQLAAVDEILARFKRPSISSETPKPL